MRGARGVRWARGTIYSTMRKLFRLFTRKAGLLRQIERLQAEVDDLRLRLVAAQGAKSLAEAQAEELRGEKDRLRARVAALKKSAEQERRVTEQLRARFEALQEEHSLLVSRIDAGDRI